MAKLRGCSVMDLLIEEADRDIAAGRVYPMPWQSLFLVDYPLLASFLGTDCRSAGGGHLVRVLSRKHSACRGPLEWWHQLRWRDRIIFADLIVIPIWRFLKTGGPERSVSAACAVDSLYPERASRRIVEKHNAKAPGWPRKTAAHGKSATFGMIFFRHDLHCGMILPFKTDDPLPNAEGDVSGRTGAWKEITGRLSAIGQKPVVDHVSRLKK